MNPERVVAVAAGLVIATVNVTAEHIEELLPGEPVEVRAGIWLELSRQCSDRAMKLILDHHAE